MRSTWRTPDAATHLKSSIDCTPSVPSPVCCVSNSPSLRDVLYEVDNMALYTQTLALGGRVAAGNI